MQVLDRKTLLSVGSIALRVHGTWAHVPVYFDRVIYRQSDSGRDECLLPKRRAGEGLGREAKAAVIGSGFAIEGVDSVYARVDADNVASIKMHEKLGFNRIKKTDAPIEFQLPSSPGPETLYFRLRKAEFKQ